jgi:autotransporter-associated beta strand protein
MTKRMTVFGVVFIAAASARWVLAASGTWTGAASAAWTNSANWTSSTFPGNGTGQTATFDGSGNGHTALDIQGVPSLKFLFFTNAAAAYAIGAGAPGAQTLVLENTGMLRLGADAAAPQTVNASLALGTGASAGSYTLQSDRPGNTLAVAGDLFGATSAMTPGLKTLYVRGDGDTFIGGNISAGGASAVKLISYCAGTLTLAGANTFDSDMEFYRGTLRLAHPQAFGGSAQITIRTPPPEGGVIEFAHEGDVAAPFKLAIGNYNSTWNIATIVSGAGAGSGGVGRNYTIGMVSISGTSLSFARSAEVTSGTPSITIQAVDMNGSGPVCTLIPTTADLVVGDVTISAQNYAKTLVLDGTAAGSRVDGVISNGINRVSLIKSNSGTWTLLGANVYTGATSVAGGTLAVTGVAGTIAASQAVAVEEGGTLRLDNALAANADRLGDAVPLTLAGGTLAFLPLAGAADTAETAGVLKVAGGTSTVLVGRAAEGQTSSLTFSTLRYEGGTVDFAGEGLGEDGRCQILFDTPPPMAGGIIGPWATVNGTALATYGPNGITAYVPSGTTDIAARGPGSVIPDDADAHVRIVDDGTSGPITLAEDDTGVASLTQANADHAATVDTTDKTLRAAVVALEDGAAALTVGAAAGDGTLTAGAPGGVLSLVNASAQPLTVRAAVADNDAPSAVSVMGGGTVVLAGAVTHTGPTAVNGGTLAFAGHEVAQTVASGIGGTGALLKNGTNLLHLLAANTYTGNTTVSSGIVRANTGQAFGSTTEGDVSVADGATLDIGGSDTLDAIDFGPQRFTVSGTGTDGEGVIVNNSYTRQLNAFGRIALAGTATFGGTADWRLRNSEPLLELNGFTLTKKGTNVVDLYNANVLPGAGHIDVEAGTLNLLYDTRLNGSAANTVTVRNGAILQFHNFLQTAAPGWTLNCDDGAILRVAGGTDGYNEWAGPVALGGGVTLAAQSAYHQRFSGVISGAGPVTKISSSTVYLLGTNNTYAGQTRISGGRIAARSLRNVGEPSSLGQPLNAADGAIVLGSGSSSGYLEYIGDGDMTDREITMGGTSGAAVLYQNGTGPLKFTSDLGAADNGAKTLYFRGDGVVPGEFAGNLFNAGGNVIAVRKEESGTWALSGTNTFTGSLTVTGGTLALTGSNVLANIVTVSGGTLYMAGTLEQGSSSCYVSGTTGSAAILRVTDGAVMNGSGYLSVGRTSGDGAFYMDGGSVVRNTSADDGERFAFGYYTNGFGYLCVSGGELMATRFQLGHSSGTGASYGLARMTGGTFKCPGSIRSATGNIGTFHIGRYTGATGVLTLDGGVLDHSEAVTFIQMGYQGGRAELNLTGGAFLNGAQTIKVRHSSGNSTGIVNVCAGELALKAFEIGSAGVGWLNLQGGTLKAAADTSVFVPSAWTGVRSFGPRGAFAGGAVIDTDGFSVTVPKPIEAPVGVGVGEIEVTAGGAGYIGEPYVSISGGGGEGASAVANMADDGTGQGTLRVANVTVTSPGWGYTDVPAVTFLRGGTGATVASGSAVLAPNASGGLTKTGAGTLTLNAANTYTGATTVAGGTLKLGNAAALPTQSRLVLAGGTLDLNGYTVTNAVSGDGTVANGVLQAVLSPAGEGTLGTNTVTLAGATLAGVYLADVTSAGDSDYAVIQGNLDLASLTLQLVDPEQLDRHRRYTLLSCTGSLSGSLAVSNLPDSRWHVVYLADGTVKLVFVDGTLIKVK